MALATSSFPSNVQIKRKCGAWGSPPSDGKEHQRAAGRHAATRPTERRSVWNRLTVDWGLSAGFTVSLQDLLFHAKPRNGERRRVSQNQTGSSEADAMNSSGAAASGTSLLLQERGLFWWADQPVPANQFAPDSAILGELKIDAEGRTTLDLDALLTDLSRVPPSVAVSDDPQLRGRRILGKLKDSNKRVLLCDLLRRGGRFASSNISFEGFRALHCLVGEQDFPRKLSDLSFSYVDVDLKGFEEWLRLGSIRVKRSKRTLQAKYHHPKRIDYPLDNGKLALIYDLFGPRFGDRREDTLNLRESVTLRIRQNKKVTITETTEYYGLLNDLFILMTDSAYGLGWPTVAVRNRQHYTLFFQKITSNDAAPRYFECLTNFLRSRTVLEHSLRPGGRNERATVPDLIFTSAPDAGCSYMRSSDS